MIYTLSIDLHHYHEWGLNQREAFVFCFLFRAPTWAEAIDVGGRIMYWVNREECCRQLSPPGATEEKDDGHPDYLYQPDSVYRTYKSLDEKAVIVYLRFGNKDLFCLTAKGKKWNSLQVKPNSDKRPTSGQTSEKARTNVRVNSDKCPTNNNSIDNSTKTPLSKERGFEIAYNEVISHFKAFPYTPKKIREEAKVQIGRTDFYEELQNWLRFNANKQSFMMDPVGHLSYGPGSFHNWISNPKKGYKITLDNSGQVYDGRA